MCDPPSQGLLWHVVLATAVRMWTLTLKGWRLPVVLTWQNLQEMALKSAVVAIHFLGLLSWV